MALHASDVGVRVTSSLNEVRNDTGRIAFCGPYVLSAITGFPISAVEDRIRAFRGVGSDLLDAPDAGRHRKAQQRIIGTHAEEVGAALAHFGYRMELKESFMDLERKKRPSLWSWMQKPRNVWVHYILAIHKGKEGHWILIKGTKLCDTYSQGKWQFVCDGPHKGAKIMEVFEVKRDQSV